MRIPRLSLPLSAILFGLTGCSLPVVSVNPLYSPEVAPTDVDLAGTWVRYDREFPDGPPKLITVTKREGGAFKIREDAEATTTDCRLVQLGSLLYLDVAIPVQPKEHAPAHLFFLVKKKDDCVGVCPLNRDKLRRALEKRPIANRMEASRPQLTATTLELQKFFREAGEDLFSFGTDHQMFVRKDGDGANGSAKSR